MLIRRLWPICCSLSSDKHLGVIVAPVTPLKILKLNYSFLNVKTH